MTVLGRILAVTPWALLLAAVCAGVWSEARRERRERAQEARLLDVIRDGYTPPSERECKRIWEAS